MKPGYLGARRETAEHAGNDDAAEEKNLDRVSGVAEEKAPCEPGGEKTVVKALIRSERLRGRGEFRRQAKSPQAEGLGPEKHLEDQEPEMEQCYERNRDICESRHLCPGYPPIS